MRIIPAIDLIDGRCVRLSQGNYATKKIYSEKPLEVAYEFEDHGIEYMHLVDLDGAASDRVINYNVLELIASKTNLKIDFGGGIKSCKDIHIAFECGANQITCGSIAVYNPLLFSEWIAHYGWEKIILGADVKNLKIATHGWLETSDREVVDFIKEYQTKGIKYVVCTDISRDGMLQGTSNELYREILRKTNIRLIASGGVSDISDLIRLKELGCEGAILGKAIYEGRIQLKDLRHLI